MDRCLSRWDLISARCQLEAVLTRSLTTPRRLPPGLAWVLEGAIRIAPLLALPSILVERGLDVSQVISGAGCGIDRFEDPDQVISFRDLGRFLDHAAIVSCHPYLGLEIGGRTGIEALGMVGDAALSAPDLGSALRVIALYMHLHDRGAVPRLRVQGERASMGYVIHLPNVPAIDHIYDGAIAIIQNIIRSLARPGWRAIEICLHRPRPFDIAPYREYFGSRLRFGSQRSQVVFSAADLSRPLATADAAAHASAIAALDEMAQLVGGGYAEKVRRLLLGQLIVEEDPECARLCRVASLLAMHPRTLNRRLRDEGASFKELIAQTRYEIACQLLRDTDLSIVEVSGALGYGDVAAFIRAFRRWSGATPAAWRSGHSAD